MKPFQRILPVIILATIFAAQPAQSQSSVGFDFLRTFVGARPSAMAGAFIAIPGDIYNVVYNPAGLAELEHRQGTATYLNHLLDFQSGFLAYAQPLSKGTFAVGLQYFDYGQFKGKDEQNMDTGEFGSNSLSLSAGYARKFFKTGFLKNLLAGGNVKFIRFQIGNLNSTAIALDLGVIYTIPSQQLNIAFGIFHLGGVTSAFIETKDELPRSFQFGFSKRLQHLPLLVGLSIVHFNGDPFKIRIGGINDVEINGIDLRLGGEFALTDQLALRLGYNSVGKQQKVKTDKDRFAGISMGLGFKADSFNVDYSFSSFGEVGSLNRVTLIGRF